MNQKDGMKIVESTSILKEHSNPAIADKLHWNVLMTLEKRRVGEVNPYETIQEKGNLAVTVGLQLLEDLLIGAGGTAFNNANSYIGVGDDNTTPVIGDTDLNAATNKLRKAMEATFPSRSGTTLSWKSIFGTSDANWHWQEWGIFNASSAGTMLNHKLFSTDPGTKTSAETWTITVQITIA